jgi:hypothetical protein
MFSNSAEWCIVATSGGRFNPKNLAGLIDMERPKATTDLQQYWCASNWLRIRIPDYAFRADSPLRLLSPCHDNAGKRRAQHARKSLSQFMPMSWGDIMCWTES